MLFVWKHGMHEYHLYTPRQRHERFRHSLTFSRALSGILSLLTSKTHQMSNSSKVYIWGGSEILPHNCIINATQTTENIQCIPKMWIQCNDCICISYLSLCMRTWHLLLNHIAMFYGTVCFILHWPLIWYWDPNTHL